jgi:multidrug resistance efflux pump
MKRMIPLVVFTALLLGGCGQANQSAARLQNRPAKPSREVYIMAGKVDATTQAAVTAKITARVARINVDVGSRVKQGDPLIILDTSDIRAQLRQAEAAVSTAQANLSKILAGSRENQISQAQANLEGATISYRNSKKSYDRIKELYQQEAVPLLQFESAQTQLAAAEAQYKSAQQQLDMLKQGETKETVNISESQLKQAQAALGVTKTQLSNGTILAPISGTVTAKNINVGELVSPGVALVSIVNNDHLCVDAYLPASLIGKVKQGQRVIVKVSEIPGKKFDGEIAVVNSVVNSLSKNVLVKVVLSTADPGLKPGMFAEIALKK